MKRCIDFESYTRSLHCPVHTPTGSKLIRSSWATIRFQNEFASDAGSVESVGGITRSLNGLNDARRDDSDSAPEREAFCGRVTPRLFLL